MEKLSKIERLMLSNQYRILEALHPDDADYYKNTRTALEEGFELHYNEIFQGFAENELTTDECREVLDILDMYRAITFSSNKLNAEDINEIDSFYLKFEGFDLNDEYEGKRVIYARYFINDLDRFQELKYGNSYADCNSHDERMPKYRAMLKVWSSFSDKYNLNKDQIKELLNADE